MKNAASALHAQNTGRKAEPDLGAGDVSARISAIFAQLTGSERRLAEVVLDASADLAALTAGELAARAGVSAATAARFFRRLGYDSYADLRRAARTVRALGSPLDELSQRSGARGDFAAHVAEDMDNLARLAAQIPPADLAAAIGHIAAARRIYLVGYRNSGALAGYMRGLLAHLKDDIRLLPLAGQTLAEDFAGLSADDVVVVFGFRRRPPILRDILALARDVGAPSVLIADATAARTAHLAAITLRCPNRGYSFFDSYVAPMCLANHIAAEVGVALGPATAG